MKANSNLYPLDILAIPKDGIREWHENFCLEDSPVRSWEMHKEMKEAYYDVVRGYSGSLIGDMLLIKYKLHHEYGQVFVALRYLQLLERQKKKAVYSRDSMIFRGIIETGVPYGTRLPYTIPVPTTTILRIGKKAKDILFWGVKKNNSLLYYFRSVKAGMQVVSTRPYSDILEEKYIRDLNCKVRITTENDWNSIPRPTSLSANIIDSINDVCNDIMSKVCDIADKYSIVLSDKIISFMRNCTIEHLIHAAKDLCAVEKKFSSIGPWHLLGGTQGAYFNRLLGLVNTKIGGKLIVFNHGNDVARDRDYSPELAIATEFITYNNESARSINDCREMFTPLNNNSPEIISEEVDDYHDLWRQNSRLAIPEKINSVMLMSSPYLADGNLSLGFPDLINLDMEIRLVRTLTRAGYKVLYKAHPDGYKYKNDFFSNYPEHQVQIVSEPFEQVMNIADAVLFYYSGTTPFTYSLLSNKTVIFIDCDFGLRITDKAFSLIKKRCRVIQGGLDERNRFSFDEDRLLEALAKKPEDPNTEFIEKYMFS